MTTKVTSKIRILSDTVSNQIAAGEVVERPSSIVKELVENAIDAGARKITVEVVGGGTRLIEVTDDGEGMSRADAELCFQRHATSKLSASDELFAVRTLGFRGEALASIASVARVRMETQTAEDDVGTTVEVAGGDPVFVRDGAFPAGTRIRVEDVFYNVPARRKFLKSESYELSQITNRCTHYALAFPEIHFVLKSGKFEVLSAPPAADRSERILKLFGRDLRDELVEYEREFPAARMKVHVFTSRPQVQKYNRNSMYFFVNGRAIRDRIILHAYSDAYRSILPSGTFPVTMLFVELPHRDVDVNVHPAKTEVRFRKGSTVHDAVRDVIAEAMRSDKTIIPMLTDESKSSPYRAPEFQGRMPDSWAGGPIAREPGSDPLAPLDLSEATTFDLNYEEARGGGGAGPDPTDLPDFDLVRSELRPLGQVQDSFIVAVDGNGLVLIDQHVAHERVLFEQYVRERDSGTIEVQRLLTPIILELSPEQEVRFEEIAPELAASGLEAEPFGPRTVAVKTAPAILKAAAVEKLVLELIDGVDRERQGLNLETFRKKTAATVACHAAIKINNALDNVKMRWLVTELMKTDCPTVCPHGRPIIVRYDLKEIKKAFKRV